MTERYRALAFDPETNALCLELAPEAAGCNYQIFDADSGALLTEGTPVGFPADHAPGSWQTVRLVLHFPQEAGTYRLLVSAVGADGAWAYAHGAPLVAADFTVRPDQSVDLKHLRVTDVARMERSRRLRAAPQVVWLPFRTVWRNRRLSFTLTKREILSRSRGSFGGALWTVLNPLLLMATYFFVFGLVLKSRFENDPRPSSFALFFLAGMLPWLAFSEAVGRAPTLLIEYRQLIRKLVFPIEMLPVNLVFSGLVGEAFGLVLFVLALLLIRGRLPWTLIYFPLLLIPQMVFTLGVCWFLSALGAFLRDLAQVNGFLLTLLFFVTPICYPESQVPAGARAVLTRNPIFILVSGYRAILLQNRAPDWKPLLGLTCWSLLIAIAAHAWFYRLKKSFADVL